MTAERPATTTILFSDLVNSTELMQRAGDDDAQTIFKAHYQVLRDAVAANGGAEVKSLGDGLMVAFGAAADAVRCAISMQQASRRKVAGEHLEIRVGLNVGDALRDEGDLFGTAVVIARRLCDRADAGQILCSAAIAHVLAGRQAFSFRDVGELQLKGITAPVAACEVAYERDEPNAVLAGTPFVGRVGEVARLRQLFDEATAGRGKLAMLVGEPGIGKTRTAQEFLDWVAERGGCVLQGRCFEGDWAPPYGPFMEAIQTYARDADAETLKQDLGYGAAPITRVIPALRERLPELPEPAPLEPEEERHRLLDAVSQFLHALSRRAPLVFLLDDIHWADRGTIAMIRHIARTARDQRILVLGAYRDVELDRSHPLADALSALRREVEYERIQLKGLAPEDVGTLLSTLAEQDVSEALVRAISDETDGNPFFIREVLAHLIEEGKLYRDGGEWKSAATSPADLGIPEGVRQVVTRRLSRLSDGANKLMAAASAFSGGFSFPTVSLVAGIEEAATLDALDEALDAQLLRPTGVPDYYDFTHALIRHTLYGEMNPSRQVRLHRQIATAIESSTQPHAGDGANHAAELAYQYHRSAAMPDAERGVPYALQAADVARRAGAWDEEALFLQMALDLAPPTDVADIRKTRAIALARALRFDESVAEAKVAAAELQERDGNLAAADWYADAAWVLVRSGGEIAARELAPAGLALLGDERNLAWVQLRHLDIMRRESDDPENIGVPIWSPDRRELQRVADALAAANDDSDVAFILRGINSVMPRIESRDEALAEQVPAEHDPHNAVFRYLPRLFFGGDIRGAASFYPPLAERLEREGAVAGALTAFAFAARGHIALGELKTGRGEIARANALRARLAVPSTSTLQVIGAEDEFRAATGRGWDETFTAFAGLALQPSAVNVWALATIRAGVARAAAHVGNVDMALQLVAQAMPAVEKAPGNTTNYGRTICTAVEALWVLQRTDHVEALERALVEKLIPPDFRYPMVSTHRSLGHARALQGDVEGAVRAFADARISTEEDGARPLRALIDYDEALMYARRAGPGDADRARPLLASAIKQFTDIGMNGWTQLARDLEQTLK